MSPARAPPQETETSSDDEDSGVDEEGMEKLMNALGEDGLDDYARRMLVGLNGEDLGENQDYEDDENDDEDEEAREVEREEEEIEEDEQEQEDAVELDNVSSVDEDAVPRQKVVIDNKEALDRIREAIALDPSLPWTETLITTYPASHTVEVDNDLDRELSFYKQALHSAEAAKALAGKHALPFTRPTDYFAEMVKSDAHMERIRQRLLDESAAIKKGEEKRREREGKKFGKQVQIEKVREREKSKKDLDEKIKSLKRKRNGGALDDGQDEDFDVALEDAIKDRPTKKPRMPRGARDEKYGRGGRGSVGWRSKQNTRDSTDQIDSGRGKGRQGRAGRGGSRGSGRRGNHGGTKRLGKSRRAATRGK